MAALSEGAPGAGERAVYVISVAAELAGVHPQTLRIYERKGLLDPSRTPGGSRRFSDMDLARLRRIQELTAEGLNLEGVRRVLELETEVMRLHAQLDQLRQEARDGSRAGPPPLPARAGAASTSRRCPTAGRPRPRT